MSVTATQEEIKESTNGEVDKKVATFEMRRQARKDRMAAIVTIAGIVCCVFGCLILLNVENLYKFDVIGYPRPFYIGGLVIITYGLIGVFAGLSQSFLRTGDLNPFRRREGSAEELLTVSGESDEGGEQIDVSQPERVPQASLTKEEIQSRRMNSDVSRLERAIYTRLKAEIVDQGRKASSNLTFGTAAALIAFVVLAVTILIPPIETQNTFYAWSGFAARIMLSLTSSIYAFFFLTTYRRNLSEIRYFHNELTNVEMRTLAVRRYMTGVVAKSDNADVLIADMLTSMMSTERNFILRKGESTTDLSQKELDRDELIALVSGITAAMTKAALVSPPKASLIRPTKSGAATKK